MTGRSPAVSVAQMREVDRIMVEDLGIGLPLMMENAGRALATRARAMLGGTVAGRRILVLAGSGGNGGGGLAAARRLAVWGGQVQVVLGQPRARLPGVPAAQLAILTQLGVPASEPAGELAAADLIIDALIGYSLRGAPRGTVASLIAAANLASTPVLALDIPSGLDGDTGMPHEPCVVADSTLTLALPKAGLLVPSAAAWVGELFLADISVPPLVYERLGVDVGPLFDAADIVAVGLPGQVARAGKHPLPGAGFPLMTTFETSEAPAAEVFWRPGCPYCSALRRDLSRRGVTATWRNIWDDEDARRFVRAVNDGNETVPTVRAGERTLTNPSGDQVARLLGIDPALAADRVTAISPPLRRALSWLPTLTLIVISEILARSGHSAISWGADALAVAAWWLTRHLRRLPPPAPERNERNTRRRDVLPGRAGFPGQPQTWRSTWQAWRKTMTTATVSPVISKSRTQVLRPAVIGALAGGGASMAMAAYAMIASATYQHHGFFTPLYHIASLFISPSHLMMSMQGAMSGSTFEFFAGPAVLGAVIHMMTGAMYGAIFGVLVALTRLRGVTLVAAGAVWGAAAFAISSFVALPAAASLLRSGDQITHMATMVGYGTFLAEHVLFGLALGMLLALRRPARAAAS